MAAKTEAQKADEAIRTYAFATFPEVTEDFPWGHRALKVKGKAFAFVTVEDGLNISTKLPQSCTAALNLPFTSPTGYGLGKSGWITSEFKPKEKPPLELLYQWIEESYRAIAPKKLIAQLDASRQGAPVPEKKKAPAKKEKKKAAARRR